jgi:hypothetical protein
MCNGWATYHVAAPLATISLLSCTRKKKMPKKSIRDSSTSKISKQITRYNYHKNESKLSVRWIYQTTVPIEDVDFKVWSQKNLITVVTILWSYKHGWSDSGRILIFQQHSDSGKSDISSPLMDFCHNLKILDMWNNKVYQQKYNGAQFVE